MSNIERLKCAIKRLKNEVAILGLVYQDPRTPWYARVIIFFVIAHTLSPIDLIPDFIPILGYLDDLVIVPLGIALATRLVPKNVFIEARLKVENHPELPEISGWWYGGFVIAFWVLLIGGMIFMYFSK